MSKIRILLIDDDKIVLRTIEKLLKTEGYELTIAESGQKAIDSVQKGQYDLIITDIRMPNIDGIETIRKIKELQKNSDSQSRFMIITGYADPSVSQRAKEMGITHFLMKPFDKDSFLEAVNDSLKIKVEVRPASSPSTDNKKLIDDFIQKQRGVRDRFLLNKALPIIGWTNTYVPEEIIMAAGFLPYRIMGAPVSLHLSKAHISGNLCSNIQSILECALKGDYAFLDGIIIGASTDATKRLYDAWVRYVNTPFCRLFDMPKFINKNILRHYMDSIYILIQETEKHFNVKIHSSNIKEAVLTCNKTRELLTDLNSLRKTNNPPISSQQFLEICILAMMSEKKYFNKSLEALLRQIGPEEKENKALRILLTGSFQDQAWLLDVIEERKALVVCEDLCTRMRYFYGTVKEEDDLIKAIAERYLQTKPASASLVSLDQRTNYILELVKDFRIDGVIYYILKFDDPYLFEFPDMKEFLSSNNIPVLRIETEHNTSALGQVMTRVQAFTETLRLARSMRARVSSVK